MAPDRETSTKAERQALALSRIGSTPLDRSTAPTTPSAAAYFSTRRSGLSDAKRPAMATHVLPQTRVSEDLARDIAIYGNAHNLTYSETIRVLLRLSLMRDEDHDD
jgi:hypothetical protein